MRSRAYQIEPLRKQIKPFRLHFFPRLRSTNDHAARLRKARRLFAPAIVLTPHQLAGRGRGSNRWWSGPGSLTVTFVFPVHELRQPHQVPLIAGLAVRNALAAHTGIDDLQLKWPNDLLHVNRKLAGLLCERIDRIDLIGLGVNVNVEQRQIPRSLRAQVTSLQEISGMTFDLAAVLVDIARELHKHLSHPDELPFSQILREYDRYHALINRSIRVLASPGEPAIQGTCVGLDSVGRLLVRHRGETSRIIAGHVAMIS